MMYLEKMHEFEGIKVRSIPTVKDIEFICNDEAKKNREQLEDNIIDLFVSYFKNNTYKN